MRRSTCLLLPVLGGCLLVAGCLWLEVETINDYKPPPPKPEDELTDDNPAERKATPFDPALTDPREQDGWLINNSAAVFKLDIPAAKPKEDHDLQALYPSYTSACKAAAVLRPGSAVLPSVNLLDGKAKQFDDGLYAALDLAYYRGLDQRLRSHVDLMRAIHSQLAPDSDAASFVAAGLEQAGVHVSTRNPAATNAWLRRFYENETACKPAGFYTWNSELKTCFRFLRFFQHEFNRDQLDVPAALAAVLEGNRTLRKDYGNAVNFYRKLSNPSVCLSLSALADSRTLNGFERACEREKPAHRTVAVFPSSASRESALFEKLFPNKLPPNANLMDTLIREVRSGKIDLRPRPESGWYDWQVHALETLLLPGRGEETNKLVLTHRYKKRMMEAFKALITKRRETHLRQLSVAHACTAMPPMPSPVIVRPRLRVEPCPSYYVRTARAYAFLLNFLEASIGKEGLQTLHGLRENGKREGGLHTELLGQRDLFYGLYLVSCEDLGMKPALLSGESIDVQGCYGRAKGWLEKFLDDPDLACDTRVSVPIFHDLDRKATMLWATLGVRLSPFEVSYVHPPHLKMKEGEWQPAERSQLGGASYLICVDEFAEVEVPGIRVLTREELRRICDRGKTKAAILALLRK